MKYTVTESQCARTNQGSGHHLAITGESHLRYLLVVVVAQLSGALLAADVTVDADSILAYVESCRKPNGAFGPIDQEYTDAAWNYPAVRTLQILGKEVARPEAIIKHGLGSPAGHAGLGHYHFYHYHAIRHALLGNNNPDYRRVAVVHQGMKPQYYNSPFGTANELLYKKPNDALANPLDIDGETFYYHNLASLHYLLSALRCSSRQPAKSQPLVDYILSRQAANGGFVDVRDAQVAPPDGDANVAHTLHALAALRLLSALEKAQVARAEEFVHSCRRDDGAYGWNPALSLPGNQPDVYYAWAALEVLSIISKPPRERDATRVWLNSLHNPDGGFGDRPGWRSRLYSTFYAVAALAHLGGKAGGNITVKRLPQQRAQALASGTWRIYQAQFKMPIVTVADLDGLHKRGFNLLALKSDKFEHAEPLRQSIRKRALPMDVILCVEAYPHRLTHFGGVVLDHVGNFTLDPRWSATDRAVWHAADKAGTERLPWIGYRDKVIQPLARLGSLSYPEQDYDLECAYIRYGDDCSGRHGYNAVLVGFNWPPHDFVRVFPWRERYVDRLTSIADVDAHGDLTKWTSALDHTRTLFIAKGPSYADFQEAAAAGRVVTAIVKAEDVPSGASYYGPAAAVEYVRQRSDQWRWWK